MVPLPPLTISMVCDSHNLSNTSRSLSSARNIANFSTAVLIACVRCTEDAGDIVVLDTEAFGSKVMESDEMWLVEFFAPW